MSNFASPPAELGVYLRLINQDEAAFIYDAIHKGWAVDGKPTPGALKLELELDQKDAGLKELPRAEQIYDFSMLDELAKR